MTQIVSLIDSTVSAVKATPGWISNAAHVLIGSRFYVAVTATFFFAFLAHLASAPTRFPPFTRINPLAFGGIAPDLGPAPTLPGEVATQVQAAARTGEGYAANWLSAWFAADPQRVLHANQAGLAVSAVALVLGIVLLARQEAKKG